jgi:O-antigen/teichoic acid export membrane protein
VDLSSIRIGIVSNISALTVAQLIFRGVSLLLSIALARYLGVVQQGVYGQILNYVAVFGAFCDLGIANLVIRDMNQGTESPETLAGSYFGLLFFTNTALYLSAVALALALGYNATLVWGIVLAGLGTAFGGMSSAFYAVIAGRQLMKRVALLQTLVTLTIAACMITVMASGGRIVALAGVGGVTGLCTLLYFMLPARRLLPAMRLSLRPGPAFALLRRGLPFTLLVGIYVVFTRIDVLILGAMSDGFTLGIYTAATRLTYPLTVFSMMVVTAVFPVLSQHVHERPALAYALTRTVMGWLTVAGLAIGIGVAVAAPYIVRLLYGAEYAATAPVLAVLIWYIPVFYVYQIVNDLLVAANRLWQLVWISAGVFVLSVVLNVLLIPRLGAFGPAWVTVGCELLRCIVILAYAAVTLRFHRSTPVEA